MGSLREDRRSLRDMICVDSAELLHLAVLKLSSALRELSEWLEEGDIFPALRGTLQK